MMTMPIPQPLVTTLVVAAVFTGIFLGILAGALRERYFTRLKSEHPAMWDRLTRGDFTIHGQIVPDPPEWSLRTGYYKLFDDAILNRIAFWHRVANGVRLVAVLVALVLLAWRFLS